MSAPAGSEAWLNNRRWALKLLHREANGEHLLPIQRDMAREGLGLPTAISAQEALDRLYDIDAEAA